MPDASQELLIIHGGTPSADDAALSALARFFGLDVRMAPFSDLPKAGGARQPAALGASSLDAIAKGGRMEAFMAFLSVRASSLFVYGPHTAPGGPSSLALLTDGRIRGTHDADHRAGYEVATDAPAVLRQLSGLTVGPPPWGGRALDAAPGLRTLITVGGRPFFVEVDKPGCPVFVCANDGVADVDAPVSGQPALNTVFPRLIPPSVYLRHAFGSTAWHREESRACLVVDDPLLKEGYGFLNFRRLAGLMDALGFTTSVAFIPWNFKRTTGRTADLFRSRRDRFSLCVHGCDHTKGEFGLCDRRGLAAMIRAATSRMESHERATGLAFDNVMVFPQGVFSTPAMAALKSNGYLCAVNLDSFPVDCDGPLRMGSFLEPAVSAFGDFPLFLRRCPEETAEIAVDLFFGRPALIMAHHDFFREGYRRAVETVERVNAIEGGVEWSSLGEIVRSSHLAREGPAGTTIIRAYAGEMVIENARPFMRDYIVTKSETAPPLSVRLGSGKAAAWEHTAEGLRVFLTLEADERESIIVGYPRDPTLSARPCGLRRSIGTAARRYMSEFRDNYISRNELLLSIATRLKKRLLP